MSSVKLGIVGCGVIGQIHLKMAKQVAGCEVVAVADLRADMAQKTAADFKIPAWYDSGEKLLADKNVEAVVLAMPTFARTDLAPKTLQAGKHLLLEKPPAMNAGELENLQRLQGKLLVACCTSRHRFLASAAKVAEVVASGVLGSIRVVRVRAVTSGGKPPANPPPVWRLSKKLNGGGIFSNWGCYDLDYLLGVTGWKLQPETVLAQTWTIPAPFAYHAAPGSDGETHCVALIRCAGGEAITVERGEFMASAADRAWQITGTHGSLHMDLIPGTPNKVILDKAVSGQGVVTETVWEGNEEWDDVHRGAMRDFVESLQSGRQPATGLKEALVLQKISDAVFASAASGAAVKIER